MQTNSLSEKCRNSFRGSCTLGNHETRHITASRKIWGQSLATMPTLYTVPYNWKKTSVPSFSLGRERIRPSIQHSKLPRAARNWLLSFQSTDKKHHTLGPEARESKGSSPSQRTTAPPPAQQSEPQIPQILASPPRRGKASHVSNIPTLLRAA